MPIEKLIRTNFAGSAVVGALWWLQQLNYEIGKYGFGLQTLNPNSTVLLFLLLLMVQVLLFLTAWVKFTDHKRALMARMVTGVFGALMLLILGALAWGAGERDWRMRCWNATNISLLLYIGLSHLAFAVNDKSKAS